MGRFVRQATSRCEAAIPVTAVLSAADWSAGILLLLLLLYTIIILRGAIVNGTYGIIDENLYIYPFLLAILGPINYGPP